MTYEATGPKGNKIRIEIPGGDLTNAKITNTASGEEIDNVVALRIEADVNRPGAQAEVWLQLVDVDLSIDAYLRDYEIVQAGVMAEDARRSELFKVDYKELYEKQVQKMEAKQEREERRREKLITMAENSKEALEEWMRIEQPKPEDYTAEEGTGC